MNASSTSRLAVLMFVVVPLTNKSPSTVKSPPTLASPVALKSPPSTVNNCPEGKLNVTPPVVIVPVNSGAVKVNPAEEDTSLVSTNTEFNNLPAYKLFHFKELEPKSNALAAIGVSELLT